MQSLTLFLSKKCNHHSFILHPLKNSVVQAQRIADEYYYAGEILLNVLAVQNYVPAKQSVSEVESSC